MKNLLIRAFTYAMFLLIGAATAFAQQATQQTAPSAYALKPGEVPTGYLVRGRTEYYVVPGTHAVRQVNCESVQAMIDHQERAVCRNRTRDGMGSDSIAK